MGSSPERVRISDMGDVIYYRQTKDYSDQDYESSKDLQRAIQRGSIVVLEHSSNLRSSGAPSESVVVNNHNTVDLEAIKQAIRDVIPKGTNGDSVKDIIPTIVTMVRQEISSALGNFRGVVPQISNPMEDTAYFSESDYVHTVSTEGMVSNIKIESQNVSDNDISSNLDLLRKMSLGQ